MENSENYHGKDIIIDEDEDQIAVRVDNRRLHISKLEDGTYATPYFPYHNFDKVEDLVHQVVDNWASIEPVVRKDDINREEN